ncbi:protein of unknown function [Cyanobium sp. NIES-981]|nr:protein of unknown function [Cyanobium sp. NIES-981]
MFVLPVLQEILYKIATYHHRFLWLWESQK